KPRMTFVYVSGKGTDGTEKGRLMWARTDTLSQFVNFGLNRKPWKKMIRFVHTNIITDDWRKLAEFYKNVFGCVPVLPERDLKGDWLDQATDIDGAHLRGCHLALPGYDGSAPTLEIFQYDANLDNLETRPNRK